MSCMAPVTSTPFAAAAQERAECRGERDTCLTWMAASRKSSEQSGWAPRGSKTLESVADRASTRNDARDDARGSTPSDQNEPTRTKIGTNGRALGPPSSDPLVALAEAAARAYARGDDRTGRALDAAIARLAVEVTTNVIELRDATRAR